MPNLKNQESQTVFITYQESTVPLLKNQEYHGSRTNTQYFPRRTSNIKNLESQETEETEEYEEPQERKESQHLSARINLRISRIKRNVVNRRIAHYPTAGNLQTGQIAFCRSQGSMHCRNRGRQRTKRASGRKEARAGRRGYVIQGWTMRGVAGSARQDNLYEREIVHRNAKLFLKFGLIRI